MRMNADRKNVIGVQRQQEDRQTTKSALRQLEDTVIKAQKYLNTFPWWTASIDSWNKRLPIIIRMTEGEKRFSNTELQYLKENDPKWQAMVKYIYHLSIKIGNNDLDKKITLWLSPLYELGSDSARAYLQVYQIRRQLNTTKKLQREVIQRIEELLKNDR